MRVLIALMFSALMLAGCGQKGDLYLPESGSKLQAQSTNMDYKNP